LLFAFKVANVKRCARHVVLNFILKARTKLIYGFELRVYIVKVPHHFVTLLGLIILKHCKE